jgi:hypothetical protein
LLILKRSNYLLVMVLGAESVVGTPISDANNDAQSIEEVVVYGRASQQIGQAQAASQGTVGGVDLAIRPLLQVAELLEAVPGMVAVQHSGSGKANQYFMRGFNLDHGTDFTNYIDGTPINFRSHGHGQGYLDVNGLIEEAIDRIDYRKGTYRASSGDFSMAGASYMHTVDRLDNPFVSFAGGNNGWRRIAGGGSASIGSGTLTTIAQFKTYDGPWELAERLDHKSIWLKYSQPTDIGVVSASMSGYSASWHPTEQIPENAIDTSICEDAFCALDASARGSTDRWIASLQIEGDLWAGSFSAQYYDWEMSSDPTYEEQINQFDKRWTFNGRIEREFEFTGPLDVLAGAEFRYDDIARVGVDFFLNGAFLAANGNNSIKEGSVATYVELDWAISSRLRLDLGLRADFYDFEVTARNTMSALGKEQDAMVLPKISLAYRITDSLEGYLNWGYGFHSNDARGVVDESNAVEGLVRGEGYEAGIRYEVDQLNLSATYWWLNLDSELSFVGDSNSVEPKGGSNRHGLELIGFWSPYYWLAIDAVYTRSTARFTDPLAAGGKFIDGALEDSGQFGVTINLGTWDLSTRVRYLGEYALLPDNSERAKATTTVNLRVAKSFGNLSVYGELLNLTDSSGKDIVYYYATNVPGLGPNEGRVSRQKEPRSFRVGFKRNF